MLLAACTASIAFVLPLPSLHRATALSLGQCKMQVADEAGAEAPAQDITARRREQMAIAKQASFQQLVDRGEAATLEEAGNLRAKRAREAYVRKLIESGEAANEQEAVRIRALIAGRAYLEKYTDAERRAFSQKAGLSCAASRGHRVRFAGVRWQKAQDPKTNQVIETGSVEESRLGFWRVQFRHKGTRYSVGSGYASEEEAARAHDEFVRRKGLDRALHFGKDAYDG
jgi:hypothetical protein